MCFLADCPFETAFFVLLFLLWSIFLDGKASLPERDMGRIRNDLFFFPFLSLFLFHRNLPAVIFKCLSSHIKCVLHGNPVSSKFFLDYICYAICLLICKRNKMGNVRQNLRTLSFWGCLFHFHGYFWNSVLLLCKEI